jgi:hypothetical protein
MYFRPPMDQPRREGGWGAFTAAAACALVTVIISFYPGPLLKASNQARPVISEAPKIAQTFDVHN